MRVEWSAPANIALVKYWGKTGIQIPANPSVSLTLDRARTDTIVEPHNNKPPGWTYLYDGQPQAQFENKILHFFTLIENELACLTDFHFDINSMNNFPHSAGISSSASFMSSLSLCLCDIERSTTGWEPTEEEFYQKASKLARLGSGSAARSVYGKAAIWGKCDIENSDDEFAVPLGDILHPVFSTFKDAILIVSTSPKPLSSTRGHELMNQNPFAPVRYQDARKNLSRILGALQNGDLDTFIDVCEYEALNLHGLIMSSPGSTILMEPNTLKLINTIQEFRRQSRINCCFTLDAGPNIHLLYPESEKEVVKEFIQNDLIPYCEKQQWIDDGVGKGPDKIQ